MTTSPYDLVLSRLEGAISLAKDRAMALCPAHEDRSPSLSIRWDGEKLLLFCHARCATEDVLTAIGLTFRDLYADPWEASYQAAVATPKRRESTIDLDVERMVLKIAAEDLRAGKTLSAEDRARVKVARLRIADAEGRVA